MSGTLPGLTIGDPPPELGLDNDDEDRWHYRPYCDHDRDERRRTDILHAAVAFPQEFPAGSPDEIMVRPFACSGSADSSRYQEATRFRVIPDMGWEEARVALKRLRLDQGRRGTEDYVARAEFALTVHGFGFQGLEGAHAVKLREELADEIAANLRAHLAKGLGTSAGTVQRLSRPITSRLQGEGWRGDRDWRSGGWHDNAELWAKVPTAAATWVRIIEATGEQIIASLAYLRATLATWEARRGLADEGAGRMSPISRLPTAAEYAEAVYIADMLAFTAAKLDVLYAGIMHSMPIYRMYPATAEAEAIGLWWPWGREVPLVDGGPPRAPRPSKAVLDPSIITATHAGDVVKQVMAETGMNRITAQKLTAKLRRGMRVKQRQEAEALLKKGATRAAVAKAVGLSPSRISAMFKLPSSPSSASASRAGSSNRPRSF
jgi:hypothetical protein